ncbi:MAG: 23S rRNA (pseudouridine(1915)-N(3))-methyltransferase RlmH [Bacteroidota bacterium]|nr:23S rRNA (pseudouridine(1915)-N(3))-methyltransferase RlmH [Bacteroidota bacterium]
MKVSFIAIGKTDETYLREGISQYVKRLVHYLTFEYIELPLPKVKAGASSTQKQEAEKTELLKLLKLNDFLVLLDDKGKTHTSMQFAKFIQQRFNDVPGNLVFLVGGAFGFHKEIYERANAQLSLSSLTFTHQMVRLIFLEQLYRAMTILRNEPYHH